MFLFIIKLLIIVAQLVFLYYLIEIQFSVLIQEIQELFLLVRLVGKFQVYLSIEIIKLMSLTKKEES
jgi:hypothetical protein